MHIIKRQINILAHRLFKWFPFDSTAHDELWTVMNDCRREEGRIIAKFLRDEITYVNLISELNEKMRMSIKRVAEYEGELFILDKGETIAKNIYHQRAPWHHLKHIHESVDPHEYIRDKRMVLNLIHITNDETIATTAYINAQETEILKKHPKPISPEDQVDLSFLLDPNLDLDEIFANFNPKENGR